MPDTAAQNFANHAKFDPPFHFFLLPLALANVIVQVVNVYKNPVFSTIWALVMAIVLLLAIFKIRLYALKVQDRVIRLEERLRLSQLLPERTRSKINELTVSQLVGLRFASDEQVPSLAENAIANNLKNADIKKAVVSWRPDMFRV